MTAIWARARKGMVKIVKRTGLWTVFLFCAALLCACSREKTDPGRVFQLYYISNTETRVEVRDYEMQSETTEDCIAEMLEALKGLPGVVESKAPLSMGSQLLDYHLEKEVLTLNMDEQYASLSPSAEVLTRAALVCSLTQIDGVSFVDITVAGNPLYDRLGNLVGMMNADQFINNLGNEINAYDMADLTLYFANEAGDSLIAVNRKMAYNTNIPLDRLVVEQLIAGPGTDVTGKVFPTINPDTQIVSVRTRDGLCYVNLNEVFLNQIYNVTADVTIYSLVNSLAELNTVNKVQISINGDTSGTYREKYSFSTVFERNLDMIASQK